MKFYVCYTAEGRRYARTQADAKALDPKFKMTEHDTDQAGIVALLNARFDEGRAFGAPAPVAVPIAEIKPGDVLATVVEDAKPMRAGLPKDYRGRPDDCPGCFRSAVAAKVMGGIDLRDAFEEVMEKLDAEELERLRALVAERILAVTAKPTVVQQVAPRSRTRVQS